MIPRSCSSRRRPSPSRSWSRRSCRASGWDGGTSGVDRSARRRFRPAPGRPLPTSDAVLTSSDSMGGDGGRPRRPDLRVAGRTSRSGDAAHRLPGRSCGCRARGRRPRPNAVTAREWSPGPTGGTSCMVEVASRELRNRTRDLLDRVSAGEHITITVDGRPVARLVPPEPRPRWMTREVFVARVLGHQADPGLAADIADLAPVTTADLPL